MIQCPNGEEGEIEEILLHYSHELERIKFTLQFRGFTFEATPSYIIVI